MLRRSERLLGTAAMARIATARVILFGVGGVGSWCAESLVRSGIRHLTIVDSDRICITNCNRQLMATSQTVGQVKVEALKERLLAINPAAEITALQMAYDATTAASFDLETYDFVIDAIDSLTEKAQLILHATGLPSSVTFFSSMGAALRLDPTKVRQGEFWTIKGDGLARALRNKFKRQGTFPRRKFQCVYSEEVPLPNLGEAHRCGTEHCLCAQREALAENASFDQKLSSSRESSSSELSSSQELSSSRESSSQELSSSRESSFAQNASAFDQKSEAISSAQSHRDWNACKAQINGSLSHITGVFGFTLAGMVIRKIVQEVAK